MFVGLSRKAHLQCNEIFDTFSLLVKPARIHASKNFLTKRSCFYIDEVLLHLVTDFKLSDGSMMLTTDNVRRAL